LSRYIEEAETRSGRRPFVLAANGRGGLFFAITLASVLAKNICDTVSDIRMGSAIVTMAAYKVPDPEGAK